MFLDPYRSCTSFVTFSTDFPNNLRFHLYFLFSALLYYHLHHHPHVHLHQPRAHVLWSGFLIFIMVSMFFLIYRNSSFVFIQLKATTQRWSGVESVSLMFHMTFDAYRAYFSIFLQIWIKSHLHYVQDLALVAGYLNLTNHSTDWLLYWRFQMYAILRKWKSCKDK